MPEKESLKDLARHKSSLCLYLSARHIKMSQKTLLEFYPPETKVIVGYRVSWDDGWTSLIELKDMEKFTLEKGLIRTTIYITVLISFFSRVNFSISFNSITVVQPSSQDTL